MSTCGESKFDMHCLYFIQFSFSVVHYTELSPKKKTHTHTLSLYLTYFEGIFPQRAESTPNECTSLSFAWVVPLGIRPLSLVLFAMYSAYWCMQNLSDIDNFTFESWLTAIMGHCAERKNATYLQILPERKGTTSKCNVTIGQNNGNLLFDSNFFFKLYLKLWKWYWNTLPLFL